MDVIVVGGGIAGVSCAGELAARGVDVRLHEQDGEVGGRLAVHRHGCRPADTGAAYLTVSDDGFAEQVGRWRDAGLLREWTDTLAVFDGETRAADTSGPMRWAAPGGLRSLVADAAAGVELHTGRTVRSVRGGPGGRPLVDGQACDAVVLAMPDPQAARLLDPDTPAGAAVAGRVWDPVLALTLGFARREWPRLPAAFVNDHPVLALVADDGDRRGDDAPVLVAHSTAALARAGGDPESAVPAMTAAVRELLGIAAAPEWTHVHRWPYAAPAAHRDPAFHLDGDGIGLAGDGWGRSRVQTAWLSGQRLGQALAERLGR